MVNTQPPPAYVGEKGPPPAYSGPQAAGGKNQMIYWSYWGVLFATLLTWVFAVAAAADDAWLASKTGSGTGVSFEDACIAGTYDSAIDADKACDLFNAAKAFQYMATIFVSVILVLVVVAAFMAAPITGRLGLGAGIALAVFAVFQLIAFALMAAFVEELNNITYTDSFGNTYDFGLNVKAGPTLGVAVVAWLMGTAGAVAALVLRVRATTDQDGPFRKCMSNITAANTGTPAGPPAAPLAVGTV